MIVSLGHCQYISVGNKRTFDLESTRRSCANSLGSESTKLGQIVRLEILLLGNSRSGDLIVRIIANG
eukprot:NODE_4_length_7232_cov_15.775164_g3_i0.p7 GENE.NODE_4_length_7232_cov_15.775164_g3_i0~~NODE_4_length_7232_cov_15.775164_g3_i0.p7  ORF type:complete len:67 (+),score=6.58 NODE_4_length_7232_cov_15.775164_g3_i0:3283-3483(+)